MNLPQYRICPSCARSVPMSSLERYCINDGRPLIEQCPVCQTKILSPYTKNCSQCGHCFTSPVIPIRPSQQKFIPLLVLVAALAWLILIPKNSPWQTTLVGKIPQSKAFIAISINQKAVMAYVCDGQRLAEWFKGSLENNQLELRSKNNAVLTARVWFEQAQGTIELKNGYYAFTALIAQNQAGLYRAENNGSVAGWIVLNNHEFRAAFIKQKIVLPLLYSPLLLPKNSLFRPQKIGL